MRLEGEALIADGRTERNQISDNFVGATRSSFT